MAIHVTAASLAACLIVMDLGFFDVTGSELGVEITARPIQVLQVLNCAS